MAEILRAINANGTVRLDLNGPHPTLDAEIELGEGFDWGTPSLRVTRLSSRAGDGEQQTSASMGNAFPVFPLILKALDGSYATLVDLHAAVVGEVQLARNIIEWQADESVLPTRVYMQRAVVPPLRRAQRPAPHCLPGIDSALLVFTWERHPIVDGPTDTL